MENSGRPIDMLGLIKPSVERHGKSFETYTDQADNTTTPGLRIAASPSTCLSRSSPL